MITIFIAEDHQSFIEGLQVNLCEPDFKIIGTANNGEVALKKLENLQPDILLLDLDMPRIDGIEVIKALRKNDTQLKILVLTSYSDNQRISQASSAGANGYILKNTSTDEIKRAITEIVQGNTFFNIKGYKKTRNFDKPMLTPIEIEILKLLGEGKISKEIAEITHYKFNSIEDKRKILLKKFDAINSTELIKKAVLLGFID